MRPTESVLGESGSYMGLCNLIERGTMLTAVCGPPGSGKTTMVGKLRQPGDIVIDMDSIYAALTTLPYKEQERENAQIRGFMASVKNTLIKRAMEAKINTYVLFANTGATEEERGKLSKRFDCIHVMTTDEKTCLERTRKSINKEELHDAIIRWFMRVTQPVVSLP